MRIKFTPRRSVVLMGRGMRFLTAEEWDGPLSPLKDLGLLMAFLAALMSSRPLLKFLDLYPRVGQDPLNLFLVLHANVGADALAKAALASFMFNLLLNQDLVNV
ncbi:hypothetical protein YC2023_080177 [Brassica napus]